MRVGISTEFIATRPCGVGTATRNVLWALAGLDPAHGHVFVPYLASARALPLVPHTPTVQPRLVGPYNAVVRLLATLPGELLRRPVDLFHAQNWSPPWLPCPMVSTIHDLSWETDPQLYPPLLRRRLSLMVRATARRSVRVVTPSRWSARDVERIYGVPPERLRVIPGPIDPGLSRVDDPQRVATVLRRLGISEPYVLYVGSVEPRKNVDQLIRAYAALRHERHIPHQLVLAGIPLRLYASTLDLPRRLGVAQHVVFTGKVPDEDLAPLYSGADVFAYLATHEGFGYPPIEAMACGTPVLAANTAALPEVLGDAALLVDPSDAGGVVRALQHLLDDADLRRALVARGLRRAARFDPRVIARQLVGVYDECLAAARAGSGAKLRLEGGQP